MNYENAMRFVDEGKTMKRHCWVYCTVQADEFGNRWFVFFGGGRAKFEPSTEDVSATDWVGG